MLRSADYQTSIEACIQCALACNNCASSCLEEDDVQHLADCIRIDQQCADICYITSQFMASGSDFLSKLCALCADVCDACAAECEKHDHDHCRDCAEACRKAAMACREISTFAA